MQLFKKLSDEEETEYRVWARKNFVLGMVTNPVWHPVVNDEIKNLNRAAQDACSHSKLNIFVDCSICAGCGATFLKENQ